MATSTRASASSPANISPVGPPPAITTACFIMPMTVPHAPGIAAIPRLWHKLEVERVGSRARWLLVLSLLLVACSDGNGGAAGGGNVSGAWCGLQVTTATACVGDEPIYAESRRPARR